MATTGTGVAFSQTSTLFIYDGGGTLVASVQGTPSSAPYPAVSSPVTELDGSVYFADVAFAYGLDASGKTIWKTPMGGTGGQYAGTPVLDGSGQLYVPGADGNIRVFRVTDGLLLSTLSLGLLNGRPRWIDAGIGKVLVIDKTGLATAGPSVAAYGLMSTVTGSWVGELALGDGTAAPYTIAGPDIGLVLVPVVDSNAGKSQVAVYDKCGNLRWKVPGDYALAMAITFNDDLIVMDRVPNGNPAPLNYDFSLRRFSKDGMLIAGPVSVPDQFCGKAFVGADDTFYFTGSASDGYRLRAFDASLNQIWTIPFPYCADAAILNGDGKIFAARGVGGKLAAVQTTSPGPAPVSWSHAVGRDARGTRWIGP
jgi:hypothetical protein